MAAGVRPLMKRAFRRMLFGVVVARSLYIERAAEKPEDSTACRSCASPLMSATTSLLIVLLLPPGRFLVVDLSRRASKALMPIPGRQY